ncbi:MAG: bis(5'-nucleosyl)-tetraphosphatase (symmetrical) YqeK [Cyanobacteriota bacterium]|nr:bis(5'-nucleosyl)-tetraphosphatase (symmetrical) YqeK [Cyanobacteriota bacterium]
MDTDYMKISEDEAVKWLKEHLTEKRFNHSLGTAECAQRLAEKYGADERKAYIAGLLHDCAKCLPDEELLQIIDEHIKDVPDDERSNKKTLHAPAGRYVAQKVFGVTDEEILSSIRWHTIGKLDMTLFEKIIFLADKIETRTRKEEYRSKIVKYIDGSDGLNKCILACYKETIKSLVDRDLRICPLTVEIYNHLEKITNVK